MQKYTRAVATWKALFALAIFAAGAVAVFAVYTFGWHEGGTQRKSTDTSVRTVTTAAGTHRIYTLRYGDVVLRPEAATQCEASGEGGIPNLFCTRIHGGRHQIIFYSDTVLVWPLDCRRCGPDGPVFQYLWTPNLLRASRVRQTIATLELRNTRRPVTYADALRAFGRASSCRLLRSSADAGASWRSVGIRLTLATLGALPRGKNACTAPGSIYIDSAYVSGSQWQTRSGLKVGSPVHLLRFLYPRAIFHRRPVRGWPAPSYWIVHVREKCVVGVCGPRYQTAPRLIARVKAGRVSEFFFPVGAEGE